MMKDMLKLSGFLIIACAIAAAALSITYVYTSDSIKISKQAELNSALAHDCLPGSSQIKQIKDHFVGYSHTGKISGYAFRVSPKGYGGVIDMVVGIDVKGSVIGIKILSMKETPGLGMKASEKQFLGQFLGKTNKSQLKAKKDIDAISGATITSQAVADGVKNALLRFSTL